ncbi:iron ABC transporter permease [Ascidiaceihabitans sp.]|uniref:FecCD family ABC transporter permease n=1 Tax=Ascidiaceihabitans sp. TaxID=1872644 RepID=UPI0032974F62
MTATPDILQSKTAMRASASDHRKLSLALSLMALCLLAPVALSFGVRSVDWTQIWSALTAYDPTNPDHVVVQVIRLPRFLSAVLAGAALASAGALMQGMTRNPLADPGLLGVNAGASIGVVICIWILGLSDPSQFIWVALGGGLAASVLVFALGNAGRGTPAQLILAGAAVSALGLALTRGVLLISQQTLDVYRFWVLGGFNGIRLDTLAALLPFFTVGGIATLFAATTLNALSLGNDTARNLGMRVGLAQILIGLTVVVLCGATVSLAGPITFVGLVVPHLARKVAGSDMRWQVLLSATFGAVLMICADLTGRLSLFGGNMQAGVMAAFLGGPVLIWIVRKHGGGTL